jgi:hypothetical protein
VRSGLLAILIAVVGIVALFAITAAIGSNDNTGEAVSPSSWADDVCGAVGAWEGQFEALKDELDQNNYAARRSDGYTGDSVERSPGVRLVLNRAIRATDDVLREGLKQAGYPDVQGGQAAALALRAWALQTELRLVAAKRALRTDTDSTSQGYQALATASQVLQQAAVNGRAAFQKAGGVDPAIADALSGSDNCQELQEEQP